MTNPYESVYPHADGNVEPQYGLTKREHFAAMAMQGLVSDAATVADIEKSAVPLNQVAVIMADKLIEALNWEAK